MTDETAVPVSVLSEAGCRFRKEATALQSERGEGRRTLGSRDDLPESVWLPGYSEDRHGPGGSLHSTHYSTIQHITVLTILKDRWTKENPFET